MRRPGIVRECEHPGLPHRHGRGCYVYDGCRCALGRAWSAEESRNRRKAKILGAWTPMHVNTVGTRRRLQALMTLGYDYSFTCDTAGMNKRVGYEILAANQQRVLRTSAEAISQLYGELRRQERPASTKGERIARTMTQRRAERRGYLPPDCWDDDSIDMPEAEPNLLCLAGQASGYPFEVRRALAVQLHREFPDMTQLEIANRASVGDKTVRQIERSAA